MEVKKNLARWLYTSAELIHFANDNLRNRRFTLDVRPLRSSVRRLSFGRTHSTNVKLK